MLKKTFGAGMRNLIIDKDNIFYSLLVGCRVARSATIRLQDSEYALGVLR